MIPTPECANFVSSCQQICCRYLSERDYLKTITISRNMSQCDYIFTSKGFPNFEFLNVT